MRCIIQCKWILIYDIIIVWFFYSNIIYATNAKNVTKFAGMVENITVYVLEDKSYFKSNNVLKLNISWLPPNGGKQPSSYRCTN